MRAALLLLLLLLLLLALPAPAIAAPVAVTVLGSDGRPLAGAVVIVASPRQPPRSAVTGTYVVAQQNIAFQPHVLIVPVGASVSFPNRDQVRHHVYSFSAAKRFDLKLYGRQETRSVTFDRAGVVALGCNIHDSMSGFVVVVDTPYAAQSDASGRVRFADVPAGPVTISVWHPKLRAPDNRLANPAVVPSSGLATTLTVRR